MKRIFLLLLILLLSTASPAQTETGDIWTMQRAIRYALDHNISIRQSVLNERLARLTQQQSQWSQLPSVTLMPAYGRSFGRSINPVSNQFVSNDYNFATLSGNVDVLLFGWFQKRNQVAGNRLYHDAAQADLDQVKNDVQLNVITGFLRVVLAKEQVGVSQQQVAVSKARLNQVRNFAQAGVVPDLDVAQLQAQVSGDSANLIIALSDYEAAKLDMKALLNLDIAMPFEVQTPDMSSIGSPDIAGVTPEQVYTLAAANFGSVRSSDYRLKAAKRRYAAAKGAMLPQLGINAQLGTSYTNITRDVIVDGYNNTTVDNTFVDVDGNRYPVYQNVPRYSTTTTPFANQFNNNFRQLIALTLTVPVFNGWLGQYNVRTAKVNVQAQQLNKEYADITLRQNVYKAYNDARNAMQKFTAAQTAVAAARTAFDYAQQRYGVGLMTTVEYLSVQNTLYAANGRLLAAQYDMVLRLKIIDYYSGKDLSI